MVALVQEAGKTIEGIGARTTITVSKRTCVKRLTETKSETTEISINHVERATVVIIDMMIVNGMDVTAEIDILWKENEMDAE